MQKPDAKQKPNAKRAKPNAKMQKPMQKPMQNQCKKQCKKQMQNQKQKIDVKADIKSNSYLFPILNFPAESFLAPCNSLGCICFTHKWFDSSCMAFYTLFLECTSNNCLRNICG